MSWNEDDWDDDQTPTIKCNCGRDIFDESEQCPYCGEYILATSNPFAKKPSWFQKLIVLIAILTLIGFLLQTMGGIF